jgi:peptidyl-prolyl cis-trans isomerase C
MKMFSATPLVAALLSLAAATAQAQNVTTVNGKPVPKARVEALLKQAEREGQARSPEMEAQVRDQVVLREMFAQEAEKRGLAQSSSYKDQLELAKQTILIRELFMGEQAKNPVTEAEMKAEYEAVKAQNSGMEYRARHILVEKQDEAKQIVAQIKAGASFEDLAKKNSKDPGSAEKGGDLDFANPGNYVPEFAKALVALKKGEMTEEPVKSNFGYHIIKLEDTRAAQFPAYEDVKPQVKQRLEQMRMAKFRDEIRAKAKTDYKFANQNGG